jgi:hypothetical protein
MEAAPYEVARMKSGDERWHREYGVDSVASLRMG